MVSEHSPQEGPEADHSRARRGIPPVGPERSGLLASRQRALFSLASSLLFIIPLGGWMLHLRAASEMAGPPPLEDAGSEVVGYDLPMEVNDQIVRWIHRYIAQGREGFERQLARQGSVGEMIRAKLDERGMPRDLLYLAVIESGLSPAATSPVSAAGVWQFMRPTAVEYGLRVGPYVDERRDPVKATDAALDYLEQLYDRFGSWYLAAAAYNAGPNRVARVLRKHAGKRTEDRDLYWEIVDQLPRETRQYVPKLIAATFVARHAREFGFRVEPERPYRFEQVFVPGGTSLASVASSLDVPVARVRELNPHLIQGVTPPGVSYPIRVPVGGTSRVVAALTRSRGRDPWVVD